MAFHHRKLLDDSFCDQLFCDTSKNPNGTCPTFCWTICDYGVCRELITIPPPPPPPPPPPSLLIPPPGDSGIQSSPGFNNALTVFLAVLAAAFFLFTCYTIYKFYTVWSSSRRRSPPPQHEEGNDDDDDFFDPEDHGPVVDHPIWYIRTIGLQPSVINSIAVVSYKLADGVVEGTDCAVCLSEFEEDETLRLLPKCNHAFHIPCIDTWLRSHTNCPLCRAGIVISAALPPPTAAAADLDSGRVEVTTSEREVEEESRSQRVVEIEENIEEDDGKVGIQGVRRSVSMDSVSASMIAAAVANAFPQQFGKNSDNELVKEKEIARVGINQQTGSSSIKRSASCSAKVFLSRHSSSRGRS